MTNIRTGGLLISVAVAGALAVAACGGGSDGSGGDTIPAGATVVEALDTKFDQKEYTAPGGEVTIAYESKGQQVHTLVIYDADDHAVGDTLRVNPGDTKVGTFDLPAGTYTLICDIPGHKEAGMVATMTTS